MCYSFKHWEVIAVIVLEHSNAENQHVPMYNKLLGPHIYTIQSNKQVKAEAIYVVPLHLIVSMNCQISTSSRL